MNDAFQGGNRGTGRQQPGNLVHLGDIGADNGNSCAGGANLVNQRCLRWIRPQPTPTRQDQMAGTSGR